MTAKPWSKLKSRIEDLFVEKLGVSIYCGVYRMASQRGSTDLPRYWITLDKQIIFDYPKDFKSLLQDMDYPYTNHVSEISALIREYIDTPVAELPAKEFNDPFAITAILKSADRRISKKKLLSWAGGIDHPGVRSVLQKRLALEPVPS